MNLRRTKLGKLTFYFKKGDKVVGERVALRKYESFESYLIGKISTGAGVAVDVGANIGYYTLMLSQRFKKVLAFEPEPDNFYLLKKNLLVNKINNAQIFQKAVSDKAGSLKLGLSKDNFGDHQIRSSEEGRRQITIKATSLDKAVKDRVSLLKIDTQGWEPKVIAGAKKIIDRDRPVIFMEFWPTGYRRAKLNYKQMMTYLDKQYGGIYLIDDYLGLVYRVKADSLVARCLTKKGYVDLLLIQNPSLADKWLFKRNFNFKHWVKKTLHL